MKRDKKGKRVKGRFATVIITRYIIFSVIMLIYGFIMLNMLVLSYATPRSNVQVEKLAKEYSRKHLKSYASVNINSYLGENSNVQILNEKKVVIYSNDKRFLGNTFTDEELSMIADYNDHMIVSIFEYTDENGKNLRLISIEHHERRKDQDTKVFIVDDNLNIVYTSEAIEIKKLTSREYSVISETATNKFSFSKIDFEDADGKVRTMITYSPKGYKASVSRLYETAVHIIFEFGLLYIAILILFSYWLYRKLYTPFDLLNKAMYEVKIGGIGHVVEYSGPKEFVDIIDQFNEMSTSLYATEQENIKLSKEKKKIISDISHDLKTPITVIQGYCKALVDGMVPEDEYDKYLSLIENKTSQLNTLINEFHEYVLMDRSDYSLTFEKTDIGEFIRAYFADNFEQFEFMGYELEIDIPDRPFYCSIDQKKFHRVLDNLLGNFFKYNPKGTTLYCSTKYTHDELILLIGDDGTGIDQSIRESIFEPLFTSNVSRTNDGSELSSGLGLSFVRKIIEAHGGTIELNPCPPDNLKTQFIIRIIADEEKR